MNTLIPSPDSPQSHTGWCVLYYSVYLVCYWCLILRIKPKCILSFFQSCQCSCLCNTAIWLNSCFCRLLSANVISELRVVPEVYNTYLSLSIASLRCWCTIFYTWNKNSGSYISSWITYKIVCICVGATQIFCIRCWFYLVE